MPKLTALEVLEKQRQDAVAEYIVHKGAQALKKILSLSDCHTSQNQHMDEKINGHWQTLSDLLQVWP
ncbi:hypothetical protein ABBQ38_006275 [Trebouxia sp. C0009 RCD-2024]